MQFAALFAAWQAVTAFRVASTDFKTILYRTRETPEFGAGSPRSLRPKPRMFVPVFFSKSKRAQRLGLSEISGDMLGVFKSQAGRDFGDRHFGFN